MGSLPKWGKYPIVSDSHIPDLEYEAAIKEFGDGLPREEAEKAAYDKYAKEHHSRAAAHHLRGSRAASASGDLDEARKHGVAFAAHMTALGYDPMDAVPPEILNLTEGPQRAAHYKFKANKADALLLKPEEEKEEPSDS
jgi:hypothetical protein